MSQALISRILLGLLISTFNHRVENSSFQPWVRGTVPSSDDGSALSSRKAPPTDPPIARSHELVEKLVPLGTDVLWLNPPGELLGASQAGWRFWQPHYAPHQALKSRGWEEVAPKDDRRWPQILLYASKHKEETFHLIAAARSRLASGGTLFFVAPNDYGAKSYQKPLGESTSSLFYENGRKSRLYRLDPLPESEPRGIPLETLQQRDDGYWSAPGLFSWSGLDTGSALLGEVLQQESLTGPVADLGAGWGFLASGLPLKTAVHLFESDRRGLECAKRNLSKHNAHYHWCDLSDLEHWPPGAPMQFPNVITNPPFHTGQREETGLGQLFARLAHRLLTPGGTLWLVGNSHLAYPRLLSTLYREVEVKAQARGFTVVKARR